MKRWLKLLGLISHGQFPCFYIEVSGNVGVRLCNVFEDNNLKFSLKKNRNTIEFIYMHYQSTDTFKNNLSKEKKQYIPFCAHKDDTCNALLY